MSETRKSIYFAHENQNDKYDNGTAALFSQALCAIAGS